MNCGSAQLQNQPYQCQILKSRSTPEHHRPEFHRVIRGNARTARKARRNCLTNLLTIALCIISVVACGTGTTASLVAGGLLVVLFAKTFSTGQHGVNLAAAQWRFEGHGNHKIDHVGRQQRLPDVPREGKKPITSSDNDLYNETAQHSVAPAPASQTQQTLIDAVCASFNGWQDLLRIVDFGVAVAGRQRSPGSNAAPDAAPHLPDVTSRASKFRFAPIPSTLSTYQHEKSRRESRNSRRPGP